MKTDQGTRRTYDRTSWFYDIVDFPFEYGRYRRIRPILFEGLSGRILEAGVGTGRNILFYPSDGEFYGVDQSEPMLHRAKRRALSAKCRVHLARMSVEDLQFPNGFFDAAVASFLMCTMRSQARREALGELRRVLATDGELRLLEYGPAQSPVQRLAARAWQPWATWAFGARLAEDIEKDVRATGFVIHDCRYVTGSIKYIEARAP